MKGELCIKRIIMHEMEMEEVKISTEFIKLDSFLK